MSTDEMMLEREKRDTRRKPENAGKKETGRGRPGIDSGNTLMDLRLVILRTIAKVWENECHQDGHLRSKIERMDPVELNQWLEQNFGYVMPYENFGIQFIKPSTQWNFYGDNQWTKPQDETLTMALPALPADNLDPYQQTELLMRYYEFFPTFFGSLQHSAQDAPGGQNVPDNRLVLNTGTGLSEPQTNFHGNDYDLGVAEDSFLSFGAVMTKLIAAAWANPELMKQLNYDHRKAEPNHQDEAYDHEIKAMLVTKYQFEFPWIFNLKFVVPDRNGPESFWINDDGQWQWRFKGPGNKQLIRNSVTLEIPNAPAGNDASVAPMALARYNAIGPAFPFTCS